VHQPNAEQVADATTLLRDHVVDVLIGQHVHVVQPIDRIAERYVVYGEGNLVSGMEEADRRDGLIAVIHVLSSAGRARVTGVDYVPTWVAHPGFVVEPVGRTLSRLERHGEGDGALAADLRASFDRTSSYVGTTPGVNPTPRRIG
jgi:poly-gamma-glutamate capsule biosynthesis protein CapA/YwtB (metallophosphatase superfamily)